MNDFFSTIAKWPIFLAGSFLSNLLEVFAWAKPLFQNPLTSTLTVLVLLGGVVGIILTLRAMLGL
jgi:Protein of unknown function (DUF751)